MFFIIVASISPAKFSNIVFPVWSFVRSLKFYYKTILPLISLEIRLFYHKLNSRNRGNSLIVFHRNSPKYSNDQRGKLDWNWLKFYGERNTGFPAITAPRLQTIKQTLTTSNNELNLLTVTLLAILKWTAINLGWLFVDGSVKQAKDWWLPLTFRSEIYVQHWSGKKIRPMGRIVKSWTDHVRVISQSNSRI